MRGVVFWNTMRYNITTTLLWGFGLGAFMIFFVLLTPALTGLELVELFKTLPPAILGAAGVRNVESLGSIDGLIAVGFFGKFALIFAAYPVVMGLRATSQEESNGTMDMLLSLPLPRTQLVLEKFIAYAINIVIMLLMVLGGLMLGLQFIDLELNVSGLTAVTLNLIPVMIFVLAMTIFVGAVIGKRQTVVAVMTLFVVASFIVQTVGAMITANWFDPIEALSFFSYYNVEAILESGVVAAHIIGLSVLAILLLGGSLFSFGRRDIAV